MEDVYIGLDVSMRIFFFMVFKNSIEFVETDIYIYREREPDKCSSDSYISCILLYEQALSISGRVKKINPSNCAIILRLFFGFFSF